MEPIVQHTKKAQKTGEDEVDRIKTLIFLNSFNFIFPLLKQFSIIG